jgi:ABC-type transport system involved in cytochrome bd biosynthesis fused ATPase/permease subunit
LVSLSPVVSKAPDFAILVRNFKPLILNGYSARKIRTFLIPLVVRAALRSKCGVVIAKVFGVYGTMVSFRIRRKLTRSLPWFAQEDPDQEKGFSSRSSFQRSTDSQGMRRRGSLDRRSDRLVHDQHKLGHLSKSAGGPRRY